MLQKESNQEKKRSIADCSFQEQKIIREFYSWQNSRLGKTKNTLDFLGYRLNQLAYWRNRISDMGLNHLIK